MIGDEDVPESDICIGHSLSVSRGFRIFRKNKFIENADDGTAIDAYETMVRMFHDRSATPGTFYTSAQSVTGHATLICTFKGEKSNKTHVWYYNPWGYIGDSRYFERKNTLIKALEEEDWEILRERNKYGKYGGKATSFGISFPLSVGLGFADLDATDMERLDYYWGELPQFGNPVTWNYIFNKLIYSSPAWVEEKFEKIMARDYEKEQNIVVEVLILLKIVYNRTDIEIIPNDKSMPLVGVQVSFKDAINPNEFLTKKMEECGATLGACSIWSFLYSRISDYMLRSVASDAETMDVITNHLPKIFLLGEKDVKHLLGKIVFIHGIGAGIYKFLRKIYDILPPKNEDEDEQRRYQEMVALRYDEALQKMYPKDSEKFMLQRWDKKISPVFFPKRESARIPIVLNFLRQITGDSIKPGDVQEIKDGIVVGGYLTSSSWDIFLQIILLVINCKHAIIPSDDR